MNGGVIGDGKLEPGKVVEYTGGLDAGLVEKAEVLEQWDVRDSGLWLAVDMKTGKLVVLNAYGVPLPFVTGIIDQREEV
jgi:hypothetical protein